MNVIKTFVDTNILIYAFTSDEPEKQALALQYLDNCIPVVSTQVIKEFSNVMLKKSRLGCDDIKLIIDDISEVADVVNERIELILSAIDIYARYKFSFYDSLVIATAKDTKCHVLLSEDMKDGQVIDENLRIVNPFIRV